MTKSIPVAITKKSAMNPSHDVPTKTEGSLGFECMMTASYHSQRPFTVITMTEVLEYVRREVFFPMIPLFEENSSYSVLQSIT